VSSTEVELRPVADGTLYVDLDLWWLNREYIWH